MAEGGVMDYLNAYNAGFKSSVDIFNYPQQQKAKTEQAQADVILTKQNIKSNELTFQAKMLELQKTKRIEEQNKELAEYNAKVMAGEDTSVAEAGTVAANKATFADKLRKIGEHIISVYPERLKEGQAYLDSANKTEKEQNEAAKAYNDLRTNQLEQQGKIALSVYDQASLEQAGKTLQRMNAYPKDFPVKWDNNAKVYMKNLAASTDAQRDALKVEADIAEKKAQTAKEYSTIRHQRAEEAKWDEELRLKREDLDSKTTGAKKTAGEKKAEREAEALGKASTYVTDQISQLLEIVENAPSVTGFGGTVRRGVAAVAGQVPGVNKLVGADEIKRHEQEQNKFMSKLNLLKASYARQIAGGGQWSKEKKKLIDEILPGGKPFDDPEKTKQALKEFATFVANDAINKGANVSVPVFNQKYKIPPKEAKADPARNTAISEAAKAAGISDAEAEAILRKNGVIK